MITRRNGLLAGVAALSYSRVQGANDRIRAGLVGCGTRGVNALLRAALPMKDAQTVAACDVYRKNLDTALSRIAEQGERADSYVDYRKLLERRDLDVVLIATPDHWHAPIAIAAFEAGKDVYVEKPLANSIADCLAVWDSATKHRRVLQLGVQQRSMPIYHQALAMIEAGKIGRVQRCSMLWGSGGGRRERSSETAPPDGLDWEMFQGPAARRPYESARQFSWRSFWEYGSGSITDLGVHLFDVMQWFARLDTPDRCFGAGIHSPARRAEQVPDIISLTWMYPSYLGSFASLPGTWGNTFWGEAGSLHVNRSLIRVSLFDSKGAPEEIKSPSPDGASAHLMNFLECVRSRRTPVADVVTACKSTIPCLLAAQSVRTGKCFRFDWAKRAVQEL